MDIKTAMALRNYGINPHSGTDTKKQINQNNSGFSLLDEAKESIFTPAKKQDFATVMKNIAVESVDTLKTAEQTAIDGVNNKADIQNVVEAMAQAEVTIKTITAVRDKVVEAYQEILRMPI